MRALIKWFRVFILPIIFIQLILIGFVTVASAQLPPEIMADKHLIHAEQLHAAKDYAGAFEVMQKIIALQKEHNLTAPDDFHFKYARVALSADSMQIALEAVSQYLSATGNEGEFYQEALKVMLKAEGNEVVSAEDFYNDVIRTQGTCQGLPRGSSCWMELTNHPDCYVWNERLDEGESAIWTGACTGHVPDGKGTLTWYGLVGKPDSTTQKELSKGTGHFEAGKMVGKWVSQVNTYYYKGSRQSKLTKSTGHFKAGKKEGKWVTQRNTYNRDGSIRDANVLEHNFVNGKLYGFSFTSSGRDPTRIPLDWHSCSLYLDGVRIEAYNRDQISSVEFEGPDENGKGNVVYRARDGSILGGPYVNGKKHGDWIDRSWMAEMKGRYVNGKRDGQWVFHYPDGVVAEGAYVDGNRHGKWIARDSTRTVVSEGAYVDGKRHGSWIEGIVENDVLREYFDKGFIGTGNYEEIKENTWRNQPWRRHGKWVYRHPNGDILRVEYKDGWVRSPWLWYDYDDEKCWELRNWRSSENKKKKKVNKKKCLE